VTTVVVIAKEPLPGRVKTRLCPPCHPDDAARIAEAALRDTLAAVARTPCSARVVALDGDPGPWLPAGFAVVPQADGDLGARLAAAVDTVAGPVLVIGMDTPQVAPPLLERACRRLEDPAVDAVLGPALDGGYWAIGFRGRRRAAFAGVPMSTDHTADAQRARLRELDLRVRELPHLRDVDTFADARAVAQLVPSSSFARSVARVAARAEEAA
jgi:uncharacterized protein